MKQLPLDLQVRPTRHDGDFIISDSNRIAAGWIDRWPDWVGQFSALNIAGPKKSGKSHLAAVWQARSGAKRLSGEDLNLPATDAEEHFILDPVDESWSEEGLFHLFNRCTAEGGSMLILSDRPVAQMRWKLPDLESRMRAVNLALIASPDDLLLHALLQKGFAGRQLVAPERVIQYLVARMERSFEAVHEIVTRMDRLSLAERRQITLALARRVMDEQGKA